VCAKHRPEVKNLMNAKTGICNRFFKASLVGIVITLVAVSCGSGSDDEVQVETRINNSVGDNSDLTLDSDKSSDNDPGDDDGSIRYDDNEPDSYSSGSVIISQPLTVKVFAAGDVSESVSEAVLESLNLAADMWGLYWPVEYWVMGLDPEAGEALVDEFCSRRDARGEWEYEECMEREAGSEQHSMIEYQQLGAQAVADNMPFGTAGHNGGFDWGIHRFASTLPWGLAGRFGTPGAEDVKTVLHEYWHAVQHSFISTLDYDKRDSAMGPVWFAEGSAEFMAQYGTAQLADQGRMPKVPKGDFPFSYEAQMTNKLYNIENEFSNGCAGRNLSSITEYSDPCSGVAYELGAWAIAHLLSDTDVDVLLEDFHPMVERVGWEETFEIVFGRTVADLDEEMKRFWELPQSEKMALLPQP
jgi:hypothetical protein